jgi:hypothetical protein
MDRRGVTWRASVRHTAGILPCQFIGCAQRRTRAFRGRSDAERVAVATPIYADRGD